MIQFYNIAKAMPRSEWIGFFCFMGFFLILPLLACVGL